MKLHGEYKVPGGKLVVVDLELHEGRLRQVRVSGDFFLEPDTTLARIDAALEGLAADVGATGFTVAVAAALEGAQSFGIDAEGVATAVLRALETRGEA